MIKKFRRIRDANLSSRENVLEIGPGKGVLTKYLLEKKINNFIVSEIDPDCVEYLKKTFQKIQIIEGDILKVKLNKIFSNNFSIISNLPYYISSQILFSILERSFFKKLFVFFTIGNLISATAPFLYFLCNTISEL